jgi:hypothetical protein
MTIEQYPLTQKEEELIYCLYEHLLFDNKTPGEFREIFMREAKKNRWDINSAIGLEKKSLVKIDPQLMQAGIMCLDLTDLGKHYMEGELTN